MLAGITSAGAQIGTSVRPSSAAPSAPAGSSSPAPTARDSVASSGSGSPTRR